MPALVPTLVYLLCFLTSVICALLLGRSYARTGARMLLWSAICFSFLALANLFVGFDLLVFPAVDLRPVRVLGGPPSPSRAGILMAVHRGLSRTGLEV